MSAPQIAKNLKRSPSTIRNWLVNGENQKTLERARKLRAEAPEKAKASSKKWRDNNSEKRKQAWKNWYSKNREKVKAKNRVNYLKDVNASRERARKYREQNLEKVMTAEKKYRKENKQEINRRERERRKNNSEERSRQTREWRRKNSKQSRESARKSNSIRRAGKVAILKPSKAELEKRFQVFGFKCAYCGSKERMTVDHVLPIKLGGLDEAANIVPACRNCNASKSARPVEEWYKEQAFFNEKKWKTIQKLSPAACSMQLSVFFQNKTAGNLL